MTASSYWFSSYTGDKWTPEKGYNQLFKWQIDAMRERFKLRKHSRGVEAGTGYWQEFRFGDAQVFAQIMGLQWDRMTTVGAGKNKRPTPEFRVKVKLATHPDDKAVFMSKELKIQFPLDFPNRQPQVIISERQYTKIGASHLHHLLSDGVLCLTSSGDQWDPKRGTVITVLTWAIEWMHIHYQEFGW